MATALGWPCPTNLAGADPYPISRSASDCVDTGTAPQVLSLGDVDYVVTWRIHHFSQLRQKNVQGQGWHFITAAPSQEWCTIQDSKWNPNLSINNQSRRQEVYLVWQQSGIQSYKNLQVEETLLFNHIGLIHSNNCKGQFDIREYGSHKYIQDKLVKGFLSNNDNITQNPLQLKPVKLLCFPSKESQRCKCYNTSKT